MPINVSSFGFDRVFGMVSSFIDRRQSPMPTVEIYCEGLDFHEVANACR